MAHFAQLDENNKVISVHVVANHVIADNDGNDDEQKLREYAEEHNWRHALDIYPGPDGKFGPRHLDLVNDVNYYVKIKSIQGALRPH